MGRLLLRASSRREASGAERLLRAPQKTPAAAVKSSSPRRDMRLCATRAKKNSRRPIRGRFAAQLRRRVIAFQRKRHSGKEGCVPATNVISGCTDATADTCLPQRIQFAAEQGSAGVKSETRHAFAVALAADPSGQSRQPRRANLAVGNAEPQQGGIQHGGACRHRPRSHLRRERARPPAATEANLAR